MGRCGRDKDEEKVGGLYSKARQAVNVHLPAPPQPASTARGWLAVAATATAAPTHRRRLDRLDSRKDAAQPPLEKRTRTLQSVSRDQS